MGLHLVGFAGWSGAGKTTLIEQLIPRLRQAGQWVAVLKHAHHAFDIDLPGKDSWRHRQAGACEVVVASRRRTAVIRERAVEAEPTLAGMLVELRPPAQDAWVLVEGFRYEPIPKIEVWRAATGQAPRYAEDPHIVAIATDEAGALPVPTHLPVLDLNRAADVVAFLLDNASRYEYPPAT